MSNLEQILSQVHKKRLEEDHLYSNFEKRYRERDFVKASELLWGSITKIASAIGLFYGKKVGKHKQLVQLMKELAEGDSKKIDWVNAAESLHANFYHNWMEEENFEASIRKVIDLRIWLTTILDKKVERIFAHD